MGLLACLRFSVCVDYCCNAHEYEAQAEQNP